MWLTNPLPATPVITTSHGYRLLISPYLLHKITPLGLHFTGLTHFGTDFPRAPGDSFEKLVGRHLALLTGCGAAVHSAITYGPENKETIGYFAVFPEPVLLVEEKNMRSTVAAQLGNEDGLAALTDRVQYARNQIDHTAGLIADRIPELAALPTIGRSAA
ncbi:hypothetical protein [Nocardia brevicatena]|uniref:hypothetical protein n=1 Tax=Nocardia brevicatena TaxID=37327 RepID=UPI000311BFE5|nr:hypothetical protein [Nocardia brevicatena]